MSNKILIVLVAVVLVILGGFVLLKQTNKQIVQQPQIQEQTTKPSVQPTQESVAQEASVTVTSSGFNPQVLTIKAGTKATWTNKSGETVTVNSDNHPTHLLYPFLNLGKFDNGSSVSVVFDKTGTYTYHNHLNASQTGKVIVQ